MFGVKIVGHRKIGGIKITIVRSGILKPAHKIATEYNGEIRINEDVINAYDRRLKDGITEAEMRSVLLHEIYHQKSFLARPYLWKWVDHACRFMILSWCIVFASLALIVLPISTADRLAAWILALVFSSVLLLLGLKMYVWIFREQEAAADAYEAMKANRPEATKAVKDSLYRKKVVSVKRRYIGEHGTLKERKAWIDSMIKK